MVKVLLIVDLQKDFLPSGALPVKGADQVIPVINRLLKDHFDVVIATKDWHPQNHISFAKNHPGKREGEVVQIGGAKQLLWPVHCVQNSDGSQFVEGLDKSKISYLVYKGTDPFVDSYSAFFDNQHEKSTGLYEYLETIGAKDIYVAGLATDYCVKYTVLDGIRLGFNVFLISDACRAVDFLKSNDVINEMKKFGAQVVTSNKICQG